MLFNDLPLRTLTRNRLDMKKTLFIQIHRETGCYRVIVVFIRQMVIMLGARRVIWLDDHPCQEGRGKGSIFAGIWLTGENPLLSTYFSFSLSFMDDIFGLVMRERARVHALTINKATFVRWIPWLLNETLVHRPT